ncbi:MAG: carbohydrate-binding family 9-like protein, partial [Kofleriaceae bacterium]
RTAAASGELVTAEGSPEPVGKATAKLTWDDQYLYVFASIVDTDVFSPYKQHDEPLWKADCIELFVDADGNRRGYIELQVNPNNATFDSWFAGPRGPAGDESWDSGMVTAVAVRGTADKGGDADQGWDVEIGIPWAAVKGRDEAMAVRLPPQVGDRWRLNVVRVDKRSGGNENVTASSWNRITYRDFHALDRMLTVVFADPTGATSPRSAAPAGGEAAGNAEAAGAGSAATGSGSGSAAPAGSATPAGNATSAGSGSGNLAPASGAAPASGVAPAGSAAPSAATGGGARTKVLGGGAAADTRAGSAAAAASSSAGSAESGIAVPSRL